jgi:hypothetical protein
MAFILPKENVDTVGKGITDQWFLDPLHVHEIF